MLQFKLDTTVHTPITNGDPTYQGAYVKHMIDAMLAAVISGVNVIILSKPGYGKTEVANKFAQHVAGDAHTNMIAMSPSTSPSKIEGVVDREELINNSRFTLNTDGTPYDPNMRVIVADEIGRSNAPAFDAWLHATDPTKQDHCTVVGLSNFMPKNERIEALLDRFALWVWIGEQGVDAEAIVTAQLVAKALGVAVKLPGQDQLPDWGIVAQVRGATPGDRAIKAVNKTIKHLTTEATALGYDLHPRQVTHWRKLVYALSVYYTQQVDFDRVPNEAISALRWAWPAQDFDEASEWAELIGTMGDPVQAKIDAVMANAVVKFKQVAKIANKSERLQQSAELGRLMTDSAQAWAEYQDDPRVEAAEKQLTKWFSQAVAGEVAAIGAPAPKKDKAS